MNIYYDGAQEESERVSIDNFPINIEYDDKRNKLVEAGCFCYTAPELFAQPTTEI